MTNNIEQKLKEVLSEVGATSNIDTVEYHNGEPLTIYGDDYGAEVTIQFGSHMTEDDIKRSIFRLQEIYRVLWNEVYNV